MVIHGYLSGLSRPGPVVHCFRKVVGEPVIRKEVMSRRTHHQSGREGRVAQNLLVVELQNGDGDVDAHAEQGDQQAAGAEVAGPILPGSISTATGQCGKPNCTCKANPPKLHGPYYRGTGFLNGKRTTKTIRKKVAQECQRRINNYRALQNRLEQIVQDGLANAPWREEGKS